MSNFYLDHYWTAERQAGDKMKAAIERTYERKMSWADAERLRTAARDAYDRTMDKTPKVLYAVPFDQWCPESCREQA